MFLKYSDTLRQHVHRASRQVDHQATQPQREAGNYAKGHIILHGLEISIETARGKSRRPEWPPLKHHYGYIKGKRKEARVHYGPETADGDHVDVFIGPHPDVQLVFVVDQIDPKAGKFDEHKVMMGFLSLDDAKTGYLDNYQKGWKGLGSITALTLQQFKAWLAKGDLTKPIADQTVHLKSASAPVLILRDEHSIQLLRADI